MTRAEDVDAHFVAQKREAGVSWAAIARMAGCAELSLRRKFDLSNADVQAATPTPAPTTPRERMRLGLIRAGFRRDDASILARMWMAAGARRSAADLAVGVSGGGAATDVCRIARKAAEAQGVGFAHGYAVTEDGLRRLSQIAGMRPAVDESEAA